jgi:hypothetical protein
VLNRTRVISAAGNLLFFLCFIKIKAWLFYFFSHQLVFTLTSQKACHYYVLIFENPESLNLLEPSGPTSACRWLAYVIQAAAKLKQLATDFLLRRHGFKPRVDHGEISAR